MKKRILITAAVALVAAAALVYLYNTAEGEGAGIPCRFYQMTGLYCAGCGASRALRSMLHLDFYQALRYNAVFTVFAPLAAVYGIALGVSYIKSGKDNVSKSVPAAPLIVIAVIALLYMVMRNIPEFSFLAPTVIGD